MHDDRATDAEVRVQFSQLLDRRIRRRIAAIRRIGKSGRRPEFYRIAL